MTVTHKILIRSAFAVLLGFVCRAAWVQVKASSPSDRARFLATVPVSDRSPLKALEQLPAYREQSTVLSAQWQDIQTKRWNSLSAWASAEIKPHINTGAPLFYMFGGPDFINAYLVYPDAPQYILCGLEPVGRVPALEDMATDDVETTLRHVRALLEPVLHLNFFVTSTMGTELRGGQVYGVLPLLYVFLARTGNEITRVEYLKLDGTGMVAEVPEDSREFSSVKGVRISFIHSGRSAPQALYYFREDVSDKALKVDDRFLKYLTAQGPGNSYLKAASYLMHTIDFTIIRDFLLAHSLSILQDDSGIPYRCFLTGGWQVSLYGNYTKPISDFKWGDQENLRRAFRVAGAAKPMPFRTGYGTRENANLLFAVRAATRKQAP